MNSTQPEESTRKSSEPFVMVAVSFLPPEAARQSAETLWLLRIFQTYLSVDLVDDKVLPRPELETFAQLFWNHNLELGRDFDGLHGSILRKLYRCNVRMSAVVSISISYYKCAVASHRNQNSKCSRKAGTKTGPRALL